MIADFILLLIALYVYRINRARELLLLVLFWLTSFVLATNLIAFGEVGGYWFMLLSILCVSFLICSSSLIVMAGYVAIQLSCVLVAFEWNAGTFYYDIHSYFVGLVYLMQVLGSYFANNNISVGDMHNTGHLAMRY